jgi:hypothetical protein
MKAVVTALLDERTSGVQVRHVEFVFRSVFHDPLRGLCLFRIKKSLRI